MVVDGSSRLQIGEESQKLEAGEAVMAASGELHGILNDSSEQLIVLTLMVPPPQ